MTKLTPEILKAAGFEPVGRDKFVVKYELRTKWQTLTIWHYTPAPCNFTMGGIRHYGDRVNVYDTEQLIEVAKALGADANMQNALEVLR
jgi:hypothetical protein